MTGFNINCIDCVYCQELETNIQKCYCLLTGDIIEDIDQNIDCRDYEPMRADN